MYVSKVENEEENKIVEILKRNVSVANISFDKFVLIYIAKEYFFCCQIGHKRTQWYKDIERKWLLLLI